MITSISRFIKRSLRARVFVRRIPHLRDLQTIREALLRCIEDCDSMPARRLSHKIIQAHTVQELWLLRNDAYQLISKQTSQTVAAERINALISSFEGWVEPRQLVRIK